MQSRERSCREPRRRVQRGGWQRRTAYPLLSLRFSVFVSMLLPVLPSLCIARGEGGFHHGNRRSCPASGSANGGLRGSRAPRRDGNTLGTMISCSKATAQTLAVVASWFFLNIAMGSSTKWIFLYAKICMEETKQCYAFKFPLTITVIHMVFSWAMCWCQLTCMGSRPKVPGLSVGQQLEKIVPLAVCFSLSVAMGNLSLKYIYPSFNQMLGAMSPLITVLLAMAIQRKRYNWWTWLSMPVICGGLAICSFQESNFHPLGAFYATGATVLRAVKSIMQGRLLQGDKIDSVSLLYYMAPWAAGVLLLLATFMEGFEPQLLLLSGLRGMGPAGPGAVHDRVTGGTYVVLLLVVSGLNACLLNVANFLVTSYTSAVTLQVLGNVKSCLAIAVSVAIFGNHLSLEQAAGVATCLFGVWLYNRKGGSVSKEWVKASPKNDGTVPPLEGDEVPPAEASPKGHGKVPPLEGAEAVRMQLEMASLPNSIIAGADDRAAGATVPSTASDPEEAPQSPNAPPVVPHAP